MNEDKPRYLTPNTEEIFLWCAVAVLLIGLLLFCSAMLALEYWGIV